MIPIDYGNTRLLFCFHFILHALNLLPFRFYLTDLHIYTQKILTTID